MIEITQKPISPESVVNKVKTDSSGCVVAYIGLIRHYSQGKQVVSVEYEDARHKAKDRLQQIASEIGQKWQINNVAICHRIGKLKVGEINLVVAIAAAHRQEGFAACQYAIDRFKEIMPTKKRETYTDGSLQVEGE
ncbi:MAG: molybdenum cofactor biosynthesis protein MoaE [Dehalococcoidales bacterium]|nr:molybdenum cofactor biosynthesis protein MoaE [Dehalococcoidales bacterium]